ncbi:TIGR03905 family TSCPD domain-containing protein [Nitratidesulfovibrio liaohensis]|uniref:TIGR03905 family TSCPD domain-containing protein n=1 Tax=Nitratidesulfovibrio liaohensis TaxID=2604158 RepID=UPI0028683496|nr:TIGR03905 family TSCPD domain-containing protein [Nitratidesulfovibrio liaohensis]
MHVHVPSGVCSKQIQFDVREGLLRDVRFAGGCPGNLEALGRLLDGMPVQDAIDKLVGITCGNKPTSCPDQLAKALSDLREGRPLGSSGTCRRVRPEAVDSLRLDTAGETRAPPITPLPCQIHAVTTAPRSRRGPTAPLPFPPHCSACTACIPSMHRLR